MPLCFFFVFTDLLLFLLIGLLLLLIIIIYIINKILEYYITVFITTNEKNHRHFCLELNNGFIFVKVIFYRYKLTKCHDRNPTQISSAIYFGIIIEN